MVEASGGSTTSTEPVDLGDSAEARSWIAEAAALHGGFDVLYNNASLPRFASIAEMTDEDWHYTMRNELDLMFYTCSAAWPHLIARGGGSIINTASICGVSALPQTPGSIAHATTKGGVIAMTRELALEGGPHNIRANSISPGIIDTPATAPALAQGSFREDHLASLMLKRIGTPQDVAAAALFLACDESSWMTGANLLVDGGFAAR
jgi:meso-butanediol dehydrogenase/(S,S)-butanediol dehydrogenase/diacetyl reductase